MLTLDLDTALEQELNELAQQEHKSLSQYVKDLILERLEEVQDGILADAIMADVISGKEPVYSLEQVKEMLNEMES